MNNKTIAWVVAAVVVVVGLGWFLLGRAPSSPTGAGNQVEGSATMTSMKSLIASGASEKCTFSTVASGTAPAVSGAVLVSGGHMRGDFTAQVSGQPMGSHMISDGTTSWVWTDASADGMKMAFTGMSGSQAPAGAPAQAHSVDPDQQMSYNCSGWTADPSEFTLPTNVTFSDMSAMMQNLPGAGAAAGASVGASAGASAGGGMCAQCDQIPDATQKAQCKAVLGCK